MDEYVNVRTVSTYACPVDMYVHLYAYVECAYSMCMCMYT